jgi:hypothetical protein
VTNEQRGGGGQYAQLIITKEIDKKYNITPFTHAPESASKNRWMKDGIWG